MVLGTQHQILILRTYWKFINIDIETMIPPCPKLPMKRGSAMDGVTRERPTRPGLLSLPLDLHAAALSLGSVPFLLPISSAFAFIVFLVGGRRQLLHQIQNFLHNNGVAWRGEASPAPSPSDSESLSHIVPHGAQAGHSRARRCSAGVAGPGLGLGWLGWDHGRPAQQAAPRGSENRVHTIHLERFRPGK